MEPVILFRHANREREEFAAAKKHFNVVDSRVLCKNQLVIARYSALPFYRELEKDIAHNGCKLINSFNEHSWIADFGYYYDLMDFTPKSWTSEDFWRAPENRYVVKGRTNSRKHQWKTHMFAENKAQAINIGHELMQDGLLFDQGVVYREYVPLKILETSEVNGMPFSNEWRFFYYGKTRLSHGFYWSTASEETVQKATMTAEGIAFADNVAEIASENATFFVLDIAEKQDGGWILIEVNDGQMSGLSENDPDVFYSKLAETLK